MNSYLAFRTRVLGDLASRTAPKSGTRSFTEACLKAVLMQGFKGGVPTHLGKNVDPEQN